MPLQLSLILFYALTARLSIIFSAIVGRGLGHGPLTTVIVSSSSLSIHAGCALCKGTHVKRGATLIVNIPAVKIAVRFVLFHATLIKDAMLSGVEIVRVGFSCSTSRLFATVFALRSNPLFLASRRNHDCRAIVCLFYHILLSALHRVTSLQSFITLVCDRHRRILH